MNDIADNTTVRMSLASKSKRDKKAGKDLQKVSVNPSGLANVASCTPVSGYNPLLGKFHTIETTPFSANSSLQVNGRFQNIDETDDYSGSSGGNGECDTLSNNGSWSGESEDHKEKTNSLRQEAIPGADSDKREKIRLKNERKHQRQKERRAQELHERCNGFLMSRKLETLSRQLLAMGFSQERATMALILNEGKIEESVAWLFEGGEAAADMHKDHSNLGGGNLKIDISNELARIADMEISYKCSRQEVERAIVICEGDLEMASDMLRGQKQDSASTSTKSDETGDPPTLGNDHPSSLTNSHNLSRTQSKTTPSTVPQQRKDDKDFNYTKTVDTNGVIAMEPASKNVQVLRKPQSKPEWTKPQQIVTTVDKRLSAAANLSVSYSLPSPLQAAPISAKSEARYTSHGSELKNLQLGSVVEPIIVIQRPQSRNTTTNISSDRYRINAEFVKPNGLSNGLSFHVPSTRSLESHNNLSSSSQLYNQLHHQQQYQPQYVSNNSMVDPRGASRENGVWNRTNDSSPTLEVASSLGLFTRLGSNGSWGSLSNVDWKTGGSSTMQLDYANIDWSLDRSSRPSNGAMMPNNVNGYDMYSSGVGARSAISSSTMVNGGGGRVAASSGETSAAGAREWASPFEEKDLFSLPRQFVSSPSL